MKRTDKQAEPKKAAIELIRVSTEQQAEADRGGIPAQKEACREIAKFHNLEVKWTIEIEGVSGAQVMRSPGMRELLRICATGLCQGVIMREESRLVRPGSFGDYMVLGILQTNGVKIYLPDGVIDFGTPHGRLWAAMKFGMADHERSVIRERTTSGRNSLRSAGKWVTGGEHIPYGFKKDTKTKQLIVDEAKMEKVKWIFNEFISGNTNILGLSKYLGFRRSRVEYILQNPVYTGYNVVRRTVDPEKNVYHDDGRLRYQRFKYLAPDEQERIQLAGLENEAPISEEVFVQAQRILKIRKEFSTSRGKWSENDPYVYRGRLRCSYCGGLLQTQKQRYTNHHSLHYLYYRCSNAERSRPITTATGEMFQCKAPNVLREKVESELDKVIQNLANPDFIEKLFEVETESDSEETVVSKQRALEAEISSLENSISRLQDLYVDGRIDKKVFAEKDDKLQSELKATKRMLSGMTTRQEPIDTDRFLALLKPLLEWDFLNNKAKRKVLASIGVGFQVAVHAEKNRKDIQVRIDGFWISVAGMEGNLINIAKQNGSDVTENKELFSTTDNAARPYFGSIIGSNEIYLSLQ